MVSRNTFISKPQLKILYPRKKTLTKLSKLMNEWYDINASKHDNYSSLVDYLPQPQNSKRNAKYWKSWHFMIRWKSLPLLLYLMLTTKIVFQFSIIFIEPWVFGKLTKGIAPPTMMHHDVGFDEYFSAGIWLE